MTMHTASTCSSCCSDEVLLEQNVDRSLIIKTVVSGLFCLPLLLHMVWSAPLLHDPWFQLCMATVSVLIGVSHFGKSALRAIKAGSANMDVLIFIGFTSAYVYSIWGMAIGRAHEFLFFETAASIVTYVLIGNVIEHRATKTTSSAIREFLQLAPQTAKRIRKSGIAQTIEEVDAAQLQTGDILFAGVGDKIAADGKVTKSDALINESMITGESLPIEKIPDSDVFAGTIVEKGSLTFEVTAVGNATVFSEILNTIQQAKNAKPAIQRIGDRVSAVFVPTVFAISVLTFTVSLFLIGSSLTDSLLRAIAVLVVACPCAMGLATPTAVMVAVGRAAKSGVLVKGGDVFERLNEIKEIIFDKTGTLTEGDFAIQEVNILDSWMGKEEVLSIIKSLEIHSNHPLAQSFVRELHQYPEAKLSHITEETGLGLKAVLADGKTVRFGSFRILSDFPALVAELAGYDLFLTISEKPIAAIKMADKIRASAAEVVQYFESQNIKTALVSGDREQKCKEVATALNIDTVFSQQKPSEKLQIIQTQQNKHPVAFVGDGVNDVPSISAASVGISFAKASSSAIASAGIVILSGELSKLMEICGLSRATVRVIKQNLFWAFFYNLLTIPLAMFGVLSPSIAALVMALSDVFVIGNSLRLKILKVK